MPDEMFQRGRRDAEADALDENFYQYYYNYRLGYDEVMRNRRRSHRQLILGRAGRRFVQLLPVLLILAVAGVFGYRYLYPSGGSASASLPATATPRPTLVPPTPTPPPTPIPELVLRADGFAVITGTTGVALLGRQAPGKDNPIVVRFPEGRVVKVLEGPQPANDMQWWRIELDGVSGWSAEPFLKPVPTPP
ncbi:MAG TPA: SH3 domain-containing protein [Herpetosiphonaceae bacterium]|nr:SH3 domain-containing protein [Herpetosiphonaceae bacterium]